LQEQTGQWLAEWFSKKKKFTGDRAKLLTLNYFEAGLLTSLEVVEFVTEIEERFSIQFTEQDFQDPRFGTLSGLSQLITERSRQESESHYTP